MKKIRSVKCPPSPEIIIALCLPKVDLLKNIKLANVIIHALHTNGYLIKKRVR